ncbi:MAG: hypothetical protein K8I82_06920 [Anaerolineae bacterium]|nr:hypothetical protein [Anaerolineae bacterium]
MQNRLQQAIELAQQGQRSQARVLLLDIVAENPTLEMAWIWLATVAATPEERLSALQRVIQINPENQTARAALQKLGADIPPASPLPETQAEPGGTLLRGFAPLEIGAFAVIVIVVMLALLVIMLRLGSEETELPTQTPQPSLTATSTSSPTPSATPRPTITPGPSPTVLVLPPTWTPMPSATPRPTITPAPTLTPLPTGTPFPSLTPIYFETTSVPEETERPVLQPVTFTPSPEN